MNIIEVWTDGGCRGNNGQPDSIGGYGIFLKYGEHEKELYEGEVGTTNNIQEMKGVINALKAIKTTRTPIKLYSDSAYVVNGINQWVKGWKRNGWKKKGGEIKNLELWKEIDRLVSIQEDIEVIKVKGHSDNEGNNRADELANIAMDMVEDSLESDRLELENEERNEVL